jgi:hypothetical protein
MIKCLTYIAKRQCQRSLIFKFSNVVIIQWYISTSWCEVEYSVREPTWSLCIYLCLLIWIKHILSKILLTQLKSDIGLLYEVIDLSDFLKTAVTLAGFQNDGKHIFLKDKLNSLQSGRQIVFSFAITIRWLISSGPDAFWGSRQEIIKCHLCPVQVWSILLLKIQMLIIFIRLLMKNTARTNHYLSGQRIWWITSGIQQKYVIHRRNIL